MSDIYPLVIVKDRYNGTYSGGKWTAWNQCYVPSKIFGDAKECADFFSKPDLIFGRGETPQEAIDDLKMILDCGISDPDEEDDKEDNEMEPTNVWKIENIDEISITQDYDEISLQLKNKDDLTKIILTGDAIKNHNEQFVTILKVDIEECNKVTKEIEKKMHKLEEKNENFKQRIDRLLKENMKLREEYEELKEKDYNVLINGRIYNLVQLIDRIQELERLKTPTLENFADEEPSTRADILDQAKKCVCGQREQDYGTPESNFQLIADLWNGYLGVRTDNPVISVTPVDVSMMMALMKIARIRNGGGSGDSFVDLAGYAACGGEIWHTQNHKDQN